MLATIQQTARPLHLPPHLANRVWHAGQMGEADGPCTPTGHARLDQELPGGGWPGASLTEILTSQAGIGEMRLLAPALRAVSDAGRHIVLVTPPYVPYAPTLAAWQITLEHVVWVRAPYADALWASEQALKNAGVGAVLAWLPALRPLALRRLQLAAQNGAALGFLIRPLACAVNASPVTLRLKCEPAHAVDTLKVEIIKRRGLPATAPLVLGLGASAPGLVSPGPFIKSAKQEADHAVDRRSVAAFAV